MKPDQPSAGTASDTLSKRGGNAARKSRSGNGASTIRTFSYSGTGLYATLPAALRAAHPVAKCGKRDTARAPSNRLISAEVGQANGPLHRPLKPARDRLEERRDDQQAILTTSPGRAVDSPGHMSGISAERA